MGNLFFFFLLAKSKVIRFVLRGKKETKETIEPEFCFLSRPVSTQSLRRTTYANQWQTGSGPSWYKTRRVNSCQEMTLLQGSHAYFLWWRESKEQSTFINWTWPGTCLTEAKFIQWLDRSVISWQLYTLLQTRSTCLPCFCHNEPVDDSPKL